MCSLTSAVIRTFNGPWSCSWRWWRTQTSPVPEIAEMDYGHGSRVTSGEATGCTAGYILRQWSVDCSPDHSLRGHEFRLRLNDHLALFGVENAELAPGYRSPDSN